MLPAVCFGQMADSISRVKIIAFGDANLGRTVGQRLLKGEVDYPFQKIKKSLENADIVFVNLESQLSEQGGETEDPKSNVIFCAPPVAASSLRRAGINVVSTANNHPFDYGMKALKETISLLRTEGIHYAGTSSDSTPTFPASIVENNGIKVGFVAYTQLVNVKNGWSGYISVFDSQRARIEIEDLKKKADFVIASYHGGKEFSDSADGRTQSEMQALIDNGADIVLGHHPHVPYGVRQYKHGYIIPSLGNFVFYQSPYWSRRSYGVELNLVRRNGETTIAALSLMPKLSKDEILKLLKRITLMSNVEIIEDGGRFFVHLMQMTGTQ